MAALDGMIFGYRYAYQDGGNGIEQAGLNFVAPLVRVESPIDGWVSISIAAASATSSGAIPAVTGAGKVAVAAADSITWAKILNTNVDAAAAIAGSKTDGDFSTINILVREVLFTGNGTFTVETLSATRTLATTAEPHWLKFDPNGASRDVQLPAVASSDGMWFSLFNTGGGGESLVVKLGAATIGTVTSGAKSFFVCDGTTWEEM